MNRPAIVFAALFAASAFAQELTLEQIMADPDWIGNGPEDPYWGDDSRSFFFRMKVDGEDRRQLHEMFLDGDHYRVYDAENMGERMADMSVAGGDWSRDGRRKVYIRGGDVYVRDLDAETTTQLTRTEAGESDPRFMADESFVQFRRSDAIRVRNVETGLEYEAAVVKAEDDPAEKDDESDYLAERERSLFEYIRKQREEKQTQRDRERSERLADPARLNPAFYLGKETKILGTSLSPSGRHLLARTIPKNEHKTGKKGTMPKFVTETGYVQTEEVRERVGTAKRPSETLHLIDLDEHTIHTLALGPLPDIAADRLSDLHQGNPPRGPLPHTERNEAEDGGEEGAPDPRAVRIARIAWSEDGERVVLDIESRDNKDRWIVAIDLDNHKIRPLFHEFDPAWINWRRADVGWLPDNDTIYFVSEADGYAHLYTYSFADGYTRQRTQGKWEISSVTPTREGGRFYFIANRGHPGVREVYRLDADATEPVQLTNFGGMLRYALSPDEQRLLLHHSTTARPYELYVQSARPGAESRRVTHTVRKAYRSIDWVEPEIVEIPSSHIDRPLYSRLYLPETTSDTPRPAVVFVHGAGYLQNAHKGWSSYFREHMFHSLLAQEGYVVLDMDYRGSAGYGRDWRTAIYRHMGSPELADLEDGVNWLVANHDVDPDRVGVYGGSYGGFLTLMALFKKPHLFACGAALRPVTDWAHYNHPYTSNILNIPSLDPDAYDRSSPVEFAEGLTVPLLIAHGMLDSNVFYQDSVRLAQRLIELEKENWELASYPVEGHGFTEPSSWLDEYRRIYKLFEENLKDD